jgi:hypothetical protein
LQICHKATKKLLESDKKAIGKRLQNYLKAIAKLLESDDKAIAKR